MKITLLLIVAWLAAASAHSSLRHHESSLELLEDFKGRVLKKSDDTDGTGPSNDNTQNDGNDRGGDDDTKKSRDNDDDEDDDEDDRNGDSTTRAHRRGHQRGGDRGFCRYIDIVDDGHDCLDDVIDAVNDSFEGTIVHLDENCNDADDDEVTCLEISDSNDCDEVVNDALDELDEFCTHDDGFNFGDGDRDGIIRLTNHCEEITLFDDGHECLEDVARAIEDEFHDNTLVYLDDRCHGNLCLMIPEDEDDCHDLSDAFVRYTRNKCSSEIRGGYDHHDGYYPNTIRIHITGHRDGHDGDKRDGDTGDTKDTDDTGHSRDLRY